MSIYIGNTPITQMGKIQVGNTSVREVWVGNTKVWPEASSGLFISNTANCARVIQLNILQGTNVLKQIYRVSDNCGTYTRTDPYQVPTGSSLKAEAVAAQASGSCTGTLRLEVYEDGYLLNPGSTVSVGSATVSITHTFTPVSGRKYEIKGIFTDNSCLP